MAEKAIANEPIKIVARGRDAPSILSSDLKVVGKLISSGELQIEGQLQGDARANSITIGEGASINGELSANLITIRGTVKGAIRGKQVHVCASATISGDVFHTAMAVESGAVMNATVKREKDPLAGSSIKAEQAEAVKKR